MLSKSQKVEGVQDSSVFQAGGDIHVGLTYTEVKDLCQTLIAAEVGRLTHEAEADFRKRLEAFEQRFYERLEQLSNKENIEKLKKPGIQLTIHDTILSSMKTDDELTKEQLLEMLIDRLNVDENDTERAVIEDAIEKATKVSKPLMALMVALQFRTFLMPGPLKAMIDHAFAQLGELFKALGDLSNLDIAYGKQLQCVMELSPLKMVVPYEDMLLRNYDLHFRHFIKQGQYHQFRMKHPEIQHGIRIGDMDMPIVGIDGLKPDVAEEDWEISLMGSSTRFLKSLLQSQGKDYMIPVLDMLLQQMPPFTKDELREYLIGLNPGWQNLFTVFQRSDVNNLQLSPVGNYLALVYTRKITNNSTEFLREIYKAL